MMGSMAEKITLFVEPGNELVGSYVVRSPSPPGDDKIDNPREVRPGEDVFGLPYERIDALGVGQHELDESEFSDGRRQPQVDGE